MMLHNNMDLSMLMVHVQQVKENWKKRGVRVARRLRQVLVMEATETTLVSVSSPESKSGNKVQGTLTLKGVQHQEKADQIPGMAMEMRCSVPQMTVIRVSLVTVES